MNPIPLSSPDGIVYAYACGECHNVNAPGTIPAGATPGELADPRGAEQCCRCWGCKEPLPRPRTWGLECAACQAISDAKTEAYIAKRQVEEATRDEAHRALTLDYEASTTLERLMSDISEECYCAGWLIGLEETLWRFMEAGVEAQWGMGTVTVAELDRLRRLHEKCGGWWEHERFVPTAEWLTIYASKEVSHG